MKAQNEQVALQFPGFQDICRIKAFSWFPALNMTSASSFQMLRGAVIIFTGLLSVAFLGRRLLASQWIGILITIVGLLIVGLADFFSGHKDDHKISDVITGEADFLTAGTELIK